MAKKIRLKPRVEVKKDGRVVNADSLLKKIRDIEHDIAIPVIRKTEDSKIEVDSIAIDSTKVIEAIVSDIKEVIEDEIVAEDKD